MKGLILSGGYGTRLRPITYSQQKQLIPVANKPILFYAIEDVIEAGAKDIGIIVGPNKEQVMETVKSTDWDAEIDFIYQGEPKGLAHTILVAEDFLDDEFVMYLGDNILREGIVEHAKKFKENNYDASIMLTEVKNPEQFGVAELNEDGTIKRLVEKPEVPPSDLVEAFGGEAIPLTRRDLDVTDPECLGILNELEPEVIINTAAYVRVDDAEVEVEKAFQVNAIGALNVAKVCNEMDAVNVYISTDYVFDGAKGEPYEEDDVPNPINVYGLSKYAGEILTRNYSEKHYVIRVASLYGKAGARGKGGNFVDYMIKRAKNGEEIKVVDDTFMSSSYTKDVSRMLKRFLDLEIEPEFGVYHIVNEGYCSWYDFTKEIFNISGWDAQIQITPIKSNELKRLARRPVFSALKNKKIEEIGLRMRNWKEALKEYLVEKGGMRGREAKGKGDEAKG